MNKEIIINGVTYSYGTDSQGNNYICRYNEKNKMSVKSHFSKISGNNSLIEILANQYIRNLLD